MDFKLACADFTFPLLPHRRTLELIGMLDMQGVDIGLFEDRSHLRPSGELVQPETSGRRLRDTLDDVGLEAADVFLQIDLDFVPYAPNHPDASRRSRARELFSRSLEYAVACGSRHVTGLPGACFEEEDDATSFGRAADEMAWRVEQAQGLGLVFSVEAHVGSIVPSPDRALRLIESVPGLTLTLDYTHFTRDGLPDSAVEPLVRHAGHFHARGACKGRLQTSFKDNTIDYERILGVMRETGYPGWLGIEYVWTEWERCNECDNLSETILFRDYFRSLF